MRALTGPGIMPAIRRYAKRRDITVHQALLDREIAGLSLFTEACERVATNEEHLTAYRSAVAAGLLPAFTGEVSRG
jgi:hypothetical protein